MTIEQVHFGLFYVLSIPLFLLGVSAGLAAVAYACWGRFERAKWLGKMCVTVGGVCGFWLGAVSVGLEFSYPWIFAIPALLGGVALAHSYLYRNSPPLARFQFTIPMLLYATVLAAVLVMVGNFLFGDPVDRSAARALTKNMERFPGIENVSVYGEVTSNVYNPVIVTFTLARSPQKRIEMMANVELQTCEPDEPLPSITLYRVGDCLLHSELVLKNHQTVYLKGLNLGPNNTLLQPVAELDRPFPFPLRSIDDLITHYDDLEATLKTWPRQDRPGTTQVEDAELHYWVEVVGP